MPPDPPRNTSHLRRSARVRPSFIKRHIMADDTSTNSGKHNEIFEQTEMSAVLLKHIKLLNYDLNNLAQAVNAKSFRNENISVTWYTNKRTLSFHGVLGNSFKELIIDLLKNELSTLAAIPTKGPCNIY